MMRKIAYKHSVALIYAIVLFLDRLDLTIVNITLPTLSKKFQVPITSTDWISIAFLLALAISIPIACWLGDKFGYKKIYVISMALFGLGSALCAFAPNLQWLIVFRFIHGIGGGMLIPVGMTIIYRLYDKSEYASITSFTFIPSLIAPAIAPFLGGIMLDAIGWQSVFLLSGPISLLLALYTLTTLKEEKSTKTTPLDWKGFVLFSGILISTFYLLSLIGKAAHWDLLIFLIFLMLLLYLFVKIETQSKHPLINLKFFKHPIFVKTNLIQLCFQICHFGAIFLIGMYLQLGAGYSASMAGLIMGMQAIGAIVISRYSVALYHRNYQVPLIVGFFGIALITPCILLIHHHQVIIFALLLFFCRGIFSGLCGTPIQTLSLISFEKEEMGTVTTIFNAARQVSISLGVAISSGLLYFGFYVAHTTHINAHNSAEVFNIFSPGFFIIPIVAIAGICLIRTLKGKGKGNSLSSQV